MKIFREGTGRNRNIKVGQVSEGNAYIILE